MRHLFLSAWIVLVAAGVCRAESQVIDPDRALYPVTGVDMNVDSAMLAVATGITTPHGTVAIRPAGTLVSVRSETATPSTRVPRYLTDPNFGRFPESPVRGDTNEARISLPRGYRDLTAGPDIFLFDTSGNAKGVTIAPVYSMPDKSLAEGPALRFDMGTRSGALRFEGTAMYGVGIDLDQWAVAGVAPAGAELVGAVVRHDGDGDFSLTKVFLADAMPISDLVFTYDAEPSKQRLALGGGGGVRGGGGSRGGSGRSSPFDDFPDNGNDPDDSTPIPAPGGALLFGLGAMALGLRRRRSTSVTR